MFGSSKPRVNRSAKPDVRLTRRNLRQKALTLLLQDFDERCAYSMQHWKKAGGLKCMEIDHFDPRLKSKFIQDYNNLFLATRYCNGAKSTWHPNPGDAKLGLRLLNCCEEQDYGLHIFEDPGDHKLVGVTPEGKFHIRICDLNAPHFVYERRKRAEIRTRLENTPIAVKGPYRVVLSLINDVREDLDLMIPPIPPPPNT